MPSLVDTIRQRTHHPEEYETTKGGPWFLLRPSAILALHTERANATERRPDAWEVGVYFPPPPPPRDPPLVLVRKDRGATIMFGTETMVDGDHGTALLVTAGVGRVVKLRRRSGRWAIWCSACAWWSASLRIWGDEWGCHRCMSRRIARVGMENQEVNRLRRLLATDPDAFRAKLLTSGSPLVHRALTVGPLRS